MNSVTSQDVVNVTAKCGHAYTFKPRIKLTIHSQVQDRTAIDCPSCRLTRHNVEQAAISTLHAKFKYFTWPDRSAFFLRYHKRSRRWIGRLKIGATDQQQYLSGGRSPQAVIEQLVTRYFATLEAINGALAQTAPGGVA